MATYSLDVLLRKWGREELSLEQAVGQILLIIQRFDQRISVLEGRKPRPQRRTAPAPRANKGERDRGLGEPALSEERDMTSGDAE